MPLVVPSKGVRGEEGEGERRRGRGEATYQRGSGSGGPEAIAIMDRSASYQLRESKKPKRDDERHEYREMVSRQQRERAEERREHRGKGMTGNPQDARTGDAEMARGTEAEVSEETSGEMMTAVEDLAIRTAKLSLSLATRMREVEALLFLNVKLSKESAFIQAAVNARNQYNKEMQGSTPMAVGLPHLWTAKGILEVLEQHPNLKQDIKAMIETLFRACPRGVPDLSKAVVRCRIILLANGRETVVSMQMHEGYQDIMKELHRLMAREGDVYRMPAPRSGAERAVMESLDENLLKEGVQRNKGKGKGKGGRVIEGNEL